MRESDLFTTDKNTYHFEPVDPVVQAFLQRECPNNAPVDAPLS